MKSQVAVFTKVIVLTSLAAGVLCAQSFTASLRGVVTDAQKAVIPNASVTATEVTRNIQHHVNSDSDGRYLLTNLQPGTYTLTAESQGFRKWTRPPFELQVQQQATIDIDLSVGDVSSTVQVESSAPQLNTSDATLGQVVDNRFVNSLPLASRASLALVALAPSITPVNTSGGGQTNTNFVANGARNSSSDVLLDGVSVVDIEQNSGVTNLEYQPSVDAIQEFKIQTNTFSAEFGNTGSAIVNMILKSGTNQFHGAVYEFNRTSALAANNWFSNRSGKAIPDLQRNVFGGTVGGPVWLPKLYNGKNRTFFFFDYEGTRQTSARTATATLPTAAEVSGDFSGLRNQAGQLITIYNPYSTYKAADGSTLRNPFANNIIPLSMQSAVARKAISYYPTPTSDGSAFTHTNNFFAQGVDSNQAKQLDAKIDHNFSEKTRFTSRYSINLGSSTPANLWGNLADRFTDGGGNNRTQNFVFDLTRTQNATTILEFRAGILRTFTERIPGAYGFDPTTLGLPSLYKTSGVGLFPTFSPEGYQELGTDGYSLIVRGQNVSTFSGSLTKIKGAHTIKTGAEARLYLLNYLQPGYPQGHFTFSRALTNQNPNSTNSLQGDGIASMLLGWGSGGDYHIDPPSASASKYLGFYVQDDWKLTRRLTVNLGLRYDFDIPRTERYNRYSWFDFNAPSPLAGKVPGYPNLKGQFNFTDDNTRSPIDGDYNNWQPRIGVAFAVDEKTAIRAGYGIYYTVSRATTKGHTGSGFTTDSSPQFSRDGNLTQYATLENPYPNGLTLPPGTSLGASTFLGLGIGTDSRPDRNPQYQNWNFSVQRQLPANSLIEVNYVGTKGTHLYFGGGVENQNRLDPSYWGLGRTALNSLVPNPFYGIITNPQSALSAPTVTLNTLLRPFPQYSGGVSGDTPNIGNSTYHAAQIRFEKRYSKGLTLLTHFTWAKLLDDSSSSSGNVNWLGGATSIQNYKDLRAEKSLSAMDIDKRLVVTASYQLPYGRGRLFGKNTNRFMDSVFGGWDANALITISDGYPIIPALQGGVLWDGTQRPNLVGDPSTSGRVQDRLSSYFNTLAFTRPAADTYGSAPRALGYRTPGVRTADASIFKNFNITETKRLQFRAEAFNVTNTPIFSGPSATYGASDFGVITSTLIGPRQIQLALKFYY